VPGVLTLPGPPENQVRYCLVPAVEPVGPKISYWPGGPRVTASPTLNAAGTHFTDLLGDDVPRAVPIFERDLWAPSTTLYTLTRWPCYPINFALFQRLPFPLIESVLDQMTISHDSAAGKATYQLVWDGLTLTREFIMEEIIMGVAIWPRRALPRWNQFFMLFAPGTKKTEQAVAFRVDSTNIQPCVFASVGGRLVQGDTVMLKSGMAAMARSMAVPRFVAMRSDHDAEPRHGILPLHCLRPDGSFAIPTVSGGSRSPILTDLQLTTATADFSTPVRVSVDFGTTNTAVALALGEGAAEVLTFSDHLLSRNLTEGWADPGTSLDFRLGFFPMRTAPTNPLSTLLVEVDPAESPGVQPFPGLSSLPQRSIPADRLDVGAIKTFIGPDINIIKQEFKWQRGTTGEHLRSAFLEMLARFVGCELRMQSKYQSIRNCELVFTCPLNFTQDQTESLMRAQESFVSALRECGFEVTLREGLVSESLANLYLIRRQRTGVGAELPEHRHVVVDVGGGSTDISVFTGDGVPMFLDSLYLGGKDLSEGLARRLTLDSASDGGPLRAAADKVFGDSLGSTTSEMLPQMLQLLLVLELSGGIDRRSGAIKEVASRFAAGALKGTPADFLTLLVFAAVYGVKLASLGWTVNKVALPEVSRIAVWFVGLGSRLFELSPLIRGGNDRLASARSVLQRASDKLVPPGVAVQFNWGPAADAKLSVCRGALMVPTTEAALDLVTAVWADFPSASPPIQWSDIYNDSRLKNEPDKDGLRRTMSTAELEKCLEEAIAAVRDLLGFRLEEAAVQVVGTRLHDDYSRGVVRVAKGNKDAPRHPITAAIDGLKENVVGLMQPSRDA
jgi:hypothetical protein